MVSVIIPTYNREKKIVNAIQSVLCQTYQEYEIIVVDDRSTDGTEKLIRSYEKKYNNIRYVRNQAEKGPGGARNTGIKNARGRYIAFLDSDDVWLPNHLQESLECMKKHGANACFSYWYEMQNEKERKSNELTDLKTKLFNAEAEGVCRNEDGVEIFERSFFEYNILNPVFFYHINTVVLERELLDVIGAFDEKLITSEDIDFIYRILCYGKYILIQNYHFRYNEGDDNLYHFKKRTQMNLEDIIQSRYVVDKLTKDGINKNRMRAKRIQLVKQSPLVYRKKKCVKHIRKSISKKYLTMAFLNIKTNKKNVVIFCVKALQSTLSYLNLYVTICILFGKTHKLNENKKAWLELS